MSTVYINLIGQMFQQLPFFCWYCV